MLQFTLKHGDVSWVERQAAARKVRPPKFVLKRPHLRSELQFFWKAFHDLSTERQVGMGQGPIPWTALNEYAKRYELDSPNEFQALEFIIREMDGAYMNYLRDKRSENG